MKQKKISNVCELPDEIVEVEPMAIACCINQFPETHQAPELIQYFRQLTSLCPLCIQIFSRDGQCQSVDLYQIPVNPHESKQQFPLTLKLLTCTGGDRKITKSILKNSQSASTAPDADTPSDCNFSS